MLDAIGGAIDTDAKQPLTGELTSFELLDEGQRARALTALRTSGLYDRAFSTEWANVVGLYHGMPGSWLVNQQLENAIPDAAQANRDLWNPVLESLDGHGPSATLMKFIFLRQCATSGLLRLPADWELARMLPTYPDQTTEDERPLVESGIRAAYNALSAARDDRPDSDGEWSKRFWHANRSHFPCIVREVDDLRRRVTPKLRREVQDVRRRFLQAAMESQTVDLYDPDRNDVLIGLASRVVRLGSQIVLTPALWSAEISAPLLRTICEATIVSEWLVRKETTDPTIYARFKDFGRGRWKLHKLHLDEILESIAVASPTAERYRSDAERVANMEVGEEFQAIHLDGSFSGTDLRSMAREVGLEDLYNMQYGPMSSASHNEWPVLRDYALDLCRNPLHRGHHVPWLGPSPSYGAAAARVILEMCDRAVDQLTRAVNESEPRDSQRAT